MATIAWFGTGMMGSGFVEGLRRRGEQVVVWNRTPEKAKALERFGARAFGDARDAAHDVDQIHIMLGDDGTVDRLLDQIGPAIDAKTIVIDHTTVAPRPTAARFERCDRAGIQFLHAPVFMSPQIAREGNGGVMLCAGPRARFARVEDTLGAMTGHLWYVGERPDKAAALKLIGNEMLLAITAGLADAFGLARSVDLSAEEAFELFSHFNPGGTIQFRGKKMSEGDFSTAWALTMARKDARLMLETAAEGHIPLHVLPTIAARMDELIAEDYGSKDLSVMGVDAATAPA